MKFCESLPKVASCVMVRFGQTQADWCSNVALSVSPRRFPDARAILSNEVPSPGVDHDSLYPCDRSNGHFFPTAGLPGQLGGRATGSGICDRTGSLSACHRDQHGGLLENERWGVYLYSAAFVLGNAWGLVNEATFTIAGVITPLGVIALGLCYIRRMF